MADIVRLTCNKISIENTSATNTITYAVDSLQDDKTFDSVVAATEIGLSTTIEYTFPSDGVYRLTTTGTKASGILTATDFTDAETIVIDTKTYTLQDTLTDVDGNIFITGLAEATALLTVSGQPADTNTVTVNGKVYTFQTTLTNVDGNVLIGATVNDSIFNLMSAINLDAGAGTLYAALTTLHSTFYVGLTALPNMTVRHKIAGKVGNGKAMATTVGAWSWSGNSAGGTTDVDETLINIQNAIELGAGAGSLYAASMTEHPTVEPKAITLSTLEVEAKTAGTAGNSIATTETGAGMSWSAANLAGGTASSSVSSTYVIYCTIQTCMLNLINEIMTEIDTCNCNSCMDVHNQKVYLYNSILLNFYTLPC